MSKQQTIQNFNDLHSTQIQKIKKKLAKKSKEFSPPKNDDILDIIGHDGLWQRCVFLWVIFATIPTAAHYMAMDFYAPDLDYWCSRPEGSNRTGEEWKNVSLPEDKYCSRLKNASSFLVNADSNTSLSRVEVVACDSWEYDTSFFSSTVLSQVNESCLESGTVTDLICSAGLWQKSFIIFFVWFSGIFVYHGLSHNTNDFTDNPFVNFAVSGTMQIPAYLLAMVAIYSQGRRRPLAVTLGISGLICFLYYPFPSEPSWFTTMLTVMGKFCLSTAASIAFLLTAEIFPTTLRTIGLGSASLFSVVALLLVPFVRGLGPATHPVIPQVFCGLFGFVSAILVLLLPETKGVTVPETLTEAASRKRPLRMKMNKNNAYEMETMK